MFTNSTAAAKDLWRSTKNNGLNKERLFRLMNGGAFFRIGSFRYNKL